MEKNTNIKKIDMKELVNKISSYNFLNYLLPGVLFAFLLKETTSYNLVQDDLFVGAFVYYFIGLVVNRVGSLVVQPIARHFKFVVFKPYSDFIKASKDDSKLDVLSETNNMFRSFAGLFLVLLVVAVTEFFGLSIDFSVGYVKIISVVFLLVLLLFAYRKQTKTIHDRIEADLSQNDN